VSSFAAATVAVVSASSIPGVVEGGMACVVIEAEADGGDEAIAAVVGEEHAGRSQEPWPQDLAPDGCFLLQDVPSWHCHRVASTNAAESNVAVELYWQLGVESHELSARVALLCHLMYEPVFDQLRTKEQLGYTVGCSHRNTAGVVGFTIYVTSASASPVKIEERAARFLRKYLKSLARMSAATYAANVSSAVANTLRDDHSLQEEAQKDLSEIQARQYCWDRAEREVSEMQKLGQTDFVAWACRGLLRASEASGVRMLSVHSHAGSVTAPGAEPIPKSTVAITDIDAFRGGLQAYHRRDQPLPLVVPRGQ